jgi:hypothetical protein
MPIDASIISQAQNIPQIRYQPESQFESFAKIQPTLNAMQQMKQRAVAARGAAEIEDFIRKSGHNINLGQLGSLLVRVGKVEEGTQLLIADSNRRKLEAELGSMEFGNQAAAPTGANAMVPAPTANAMARPAAGQPSVPSPAVTAPPMPATAPSMAPQGQPTGFRPTVQQLARMAAIDDVGARVAGVLSPFAEKPQPVPEKIRMMRQFGFPETKEGYRQFEEFGRAPQDTRTSDVKNYEAARKGGFQGSFYDYLTGLRKAGATSLAQKLESGEQTAKGKMNVDQYKDIVTAANIARRTLPALETQQRVLDEGFKTGFGTEAQKVGASVLSALGVPEAEKFATNAEVFISAMNQAVLQRQLEQKGPQTEADAQRITATGAQLGNTVEANKFIIAVAKAQLKRDLQQRQFWDAYWNKNQTYEGVEQAWEAGAGGKSLFDMPELSAYARPTPSSQSGRGAAGQRPASGVDSSNPLLQ